MLTIKNLNKSYFTNGKQKKVLDNISFKVKKNECIGIIGENGSGKTTFLKVLAGIVKSDNGTINSKKKIDSLLDLNFGLNEELNLVENINYFFKSNDISVSDDLIKKVIEFSELVNNEGLKIKHYSSGMRARLGFTLNTIFSSNSILIIDEVLAVGDHEFSQKSKKKILEIVRNNQACILVSHDMNFVKTICNRCLWFKDGKINEDGNPSKVIDRYMEYSFLKNENKVNAVLSKKNLRVFSNKKIYKVHEDINIKLSSKDLKKLQIKKIIFEIYRSDRIKMIQKEITKEKIKKLKENFINLCIKEPIIGCGLFFVIIRIFFSGIEKSEVLQISINIEDKNEKIKNSLVVPKDVVWKIF